MIDVDQTVIQRIIQHEGQIPYAYQDSNGFWTIGVGRLIDHREGGHLSEDEMHYLLMNDLGNICQSLRPYEWFTKQDVVRKGVLIELCFNMGLPHLLEFHNMLAAFQDEDYEKAEQELIDSLWAQQVSAERSDDLCYRILHGSYK